MPYTIIESQLPLIGGLAGHNLIVVKDPAGNVISEFNGLAVGADNIPKAIGYLPSDKLKVFEFNQATFYAPDQAQTVVFSGTLEQVTARIQAAEQCAIQMNSNDMGYPFLGLGKNSNSVASTLLECMGIVETPVPGSAWIMPGVGDILLPQDFIDSVLSQYQLNDGVGTSWDTGSQYDYYYSDPSHYDVWGGFSDGGGGGGCVAVASILPGGMRAGEIRVGDTMQLADAKTLSAGSGVVSYSECKQAQGVRLVTASGASLVCSDTAPIPTPDGLMLAPDLLGKQVAVRRDSEKPGVPAWELVVAVEPIGAISVQHITVGDKCFWAGEKDKVYILHHNLKNADDGGDWWDNPWLTAAPLTSLENSVSVSLIAKNEQLMIM